MKDRYTFNVASTDKNITVVVDIEDDVTWVQPLQEFVRFLSNAYGYDIGKNIDITRRNFHGEEDTTNLMEIC